MFPKLFEPFSIRSLTMRNRIVMPAMGTRMCDERAVTDKLVEYHRVRAAGGVGLSIVEVTAVHAPSSPNCFLSLAEDRFIEGHKRLTDAIHAEGGRVGVQLWQGSIAVAMDPAAQILVPNEMTVHGFTIPGITVEQIHEVIDCYGAAAARCVRRAMTASNSIAPTITSRTPSSPRASTTVATNGEAAWRIAPSSHSPASARSARTSLRICPCSCASTLMTTASRAA